MKRILRSILSVLLILMIGCVMTGCTKADVPNWLSWLPWLEEVDTEPEIEPISCEIMFAKTVDEKYQATEWYEGDEFEINTKIYVIVDFTLINYGAEDDIVEFKIQIPYAKYYSAHEYEKGVVAPKEEYKDVMNDDGTFESMVEL